jgi:NAD-dependent dihydropyrimidine dehydrogenase PreA subunit
MGLLRQEEHPPRNDKGYFGGPMFIVTIDIDKCKACGDCVENCPQQAITMIEEDGKKYAMFTGSPDDCIGCMSCETCEDGAVTITEI